MILYKRVQNKWNAYTICQIVVLNVNCYAMSGVLHVKLSKRAKESNAKSHYKVIYRNE